ncbi:hypothetical protein O9992_22160 [Vibrio lentus]|nr:hypothetical protein [Vibrio lentus]
MAEDFYRERRYWEYEATPNVNELIDDKYQGVRAIRGAVNPTWAATFDIQPDAYSWHNVKRMEGLSAEIHFDGVPPLSKHPRYLSG